jgi:hypothetical protein
MTAKLCAPGGVAWVVAVVLAFWLAGAQPAIEVIEMRPARNIRERFGILIYLRFSFEYELTMHYRKKRAGNKPRPLLEV